MQERLPHYNIGRFEHEEHENCEYYRRADNSVELRTVGIPHLTANEGAEVETVVIQKAEDRTKECARQCVPKRVASILSSADHRVVIEP